MTLDKVNNRLFIGHHGNSRYDIYQIDAKGLPKQQHAVGSVGRSLIGHGFTSPPLNNKELSWPSGGDFDEVHQRLFVPERSMSGGPGGRVMVYDLSPKKLAMLGRNELPEAIAVLGQPGFETIDRSSGPARVGSSGQAVVDEERQLLFYTDSANNRVLVWDIDPAKLKTGQEAIMAIGQPDLHSREAGTGKSSLQRPSFMAYDPLRKHLFVSDQKKRVMVFDVNTKNLDRKGGLEAFAVIGQTNFDSGAPRTSKRKFSGRGPISLDYKYHRLFSGTFTENRVLVFDVDMDKLDGASNPDAIAVLGQPDFESTDPAVTQTRLTMTRITVDSEQQLAYVPDGYPAGNHINIFDIHPDRMKTVLTPMIDQLGHINPEGEPDFLARSANDRISPRFWTQGRDVSVDTTDHRLFMSDNYGHRIMIFKLDRMNRLLDRGASWALGQKDPSTSVLLPGRDATTMKLPMAMEYDDSHKRLFVADTWNDRVLVYDMTPDQVSSGMAASYVLGQRDFTSYQPGATQDRLYFGSREARGIGPSGGRPAELAIDRVNQRLFVADGANNRVMVFDMHPDRIRNGAKALAVLGQDDFTSKEEGLSATRWKVPGDMVMDETHQRLFVEVPFQNRVLVFDVHPDRINNGLAASHVIGQASFNSQEPGLSKSKIQQPDGISYDAKNDYLYLTDKYHDRILTFDVHPDRLKNLPEAIAVIGEPDFDKVRIGPGVPRIHQDRIYDPRGSHFDPVDQRLYQSEGVNGRMTVFTLPRENYRVDLPARSNLRYASLDALMATGQEALQTGYSQAKVLEAAKLAAVSTHYVTQPLIQAESARQSRELLSEAMLVAEAPLKSGLLYVDKRAGREVALSVVNGSKSTARLTFNLLTVSGERLKETRRVGGNSQLSLRMVDLFPGRSNLQGALSVSANRAVSMSALLEIADGRRNVLLSPAPLVGERETTTDLMKARRVLPELTTGAGQEVSTVLLNPSKETMTGQIEISGQAPVSYSVEPGGVFVHTLPSDGRPLLRGLGIIRASQGTAPSAYAVVASSRRDSSLRSVHTVSSHQEGSLFWGPVNTYPDVLHHGEIESQLSVVNEGIVPATIYLEMFDLDGQSSGKYERTIPLGESVSLSIEEVFGRSPIRGTLRVFADTEVAVSLLERTLTVSDEEVVMDVPLQATPTEAITSLVFPVFRNGEGQATEVLMMNTDRRTHSGTLAIHNSEGKTQEMILR